jgi:hypothetical protein
MDQAGPISGQQIGGGAWHDVAGCQGRARKPPIVASDPLGGKNRRARGGPPRARPPRGVWRYRDRPTRAAMVDHGPSSAAADACSAIRGAVNGGRRDGGRPSTTACQFRPVSTTRAGRWGRGGCGCAAEARTRWKTCRNTTRPQARGAARLDDVPGDMVVSALPCISGVGGAQSIA